LNFETNAKIPYSPSQNSRYGTYSAFTRHRLTNERPRILLDAG